MVTIAVTAEGRGRASRGGVAGNRKKLTALGASVRVQAGRRVAFAVLRRGARRRRAPTINADATSTLAGAEHSAQGAAAIASTRSRPSSRGAIVAAMLCAL